jgi:hypothetical protein
MAAKGATIANVTAKNATNSLLMHFPSMNSRPEGHPELSRSATEAFNLARLCGNAYRFSEVLRCVVNPG